MVAGGATFDGGATYGTLVSNTTLSGSFSIELILMKVLSISLRTGSAVDPGSSQCDTNSSVRSALPTKPKYRTKGIALYPSTASRIEGCGDVCVRQRGELGLRSMRAGVGTGDQDDESKDNGH